MFSQKKKKLTSNNDAVVMMKRSQQKIVSTKKTTKLVPRRRENDEENDEENPNPHVFFKFRGGNADEMTKKLQEICQGELNRIDEIYRIRKEYFDHIYRIDYHPSPPKTSADNTWNNLLQVFKTCWSFLWKNKLPILIGMIIIAVVCLCICNSTYLILLFSFIWKTSVSVAVVQTWIPNFITGLIKSQVSQLLVYIFNNQMELIVLIVSRTLLSLFQVDCCNGSTLSCFVMNWLNMNKRRGTIKPPAAVDVEQTGGGKYNDKQTASSNNDDNDNNQEIRETFLRLFNYLWQNYENVKLIIDEWDIQNQNTFQEIEKDFTKSMERTVAGGGLIREMALNYGAQYFSLSKFNTIRSIHNNFIVTDGVYKLILNCFHFLTGTTYNEKDEQNEKDSIYDIDKLVRDPNLEFSPRDYRKFILALENYILKAGKDDEKTTLTNYWFHQTSVLPKIVFSILIHALIIYFMYSSTRVFTKINVMEFLNGILVHAKISHMYIFLVLSSQIPTLLSKLNYLYTFLVLVRLIYIIPMCCFFKDFKKYPFTNKDASSLNLMIFIGQLHTASCGSNKRSFTGNIATQIGKLFQLVVSFITNTMNASTKLLMSMFSSTGEIFMKLFSRQTHSTEKPGNNLSDELTQIVNHYLSLFLNKKNPKFSNYAEKFLFQQYLIFKNQQNKFDTTRFNDYVQDQLQTYIRKEIQIESPSEPYEQYEQVLFRQINTLITIFEPSYTFVWDMRNLIFMKNYLFIQINHIVNNDQNNTTPKLMDRGTNRILDCLENKFIYDKESISYKIEHKNIRAFQATTTTTTTTTTIYKYMEYIKNIKSDFIKDFAIIVQLNAALSKTTISSEKSISSMIEMTKKMRKFPKELLQNLLEQMLHEIKQLEENTTEEMQNKLNESQKKKLELIQAFLKKRAELKTQLTEEMDNFRKLFIHILAMQKKKF